MRSERTYLVEYRRSGRGHRDDPIKTLKLQAMTGKEATAAAKAHPKLTGKKILSVNVDPKYWEKLTKQEAKKAAQKAKARKAPAAKPSHSKVKA